jgi:hypothetical protein
MKPFVLERRPSYFVLQTHSNKLASFPSKLSSNVKMSNPVANNNLPATNKDENAPEPQHVLSIYDVYENLFRHYSAEELEYSLEELLEDMTVQAEEKGKLAVEHATEPPQNAGPSGKTVIM